MNFSDGNRYIGEWKDDTMHGKGKLYHINGDVYEGIWRDNSMSGNGSFDITC